MYEDHSWCALRANIFLSEHSLIISVWILKNPGVKEKTIYNTVKDGREDYSKGTTAMFCCRGERSGSTQYVKKDKWEFTAKKLSGEGRQGMDNY